MYPSTTTNGNYSLYDCNNDIYLSEQHYCPPSSSSPFQLLSPHYISMEDGTILSELLQESASSDANIVVHQQLAIDHGIRTNSRRPTSSKKDRHSKINTAQGPRDRRMRLSLEVAKKFFKVQDMLGFDKASKTVEWLLMKSKSDIQKLLPQNLIHKSSKCEDLSDQSVENKSSNHKEKKKKKSRGVRKSAYLLRPLAKETREKARARARERTMVKSSRFGQDSKFRPCLDLGSSTFGEPAEQSRTHFQQQGIVDDNSSSMTDKWSPPFNYQHPDQVLLHEQHQLNGFQILGNFWECNN